MPAGRSRVLWNIMMGASLLVCGSASAYMLLLKGGKWGVFAAIAFLAAAGAVDLRRRARRSAA